MVRFRCPQGCGSYHEHPDSLVGVRTTCPNTYRSYRVLPVPPNDMPGPYTVAEAWDLLSEKILPIFKPFRLHNSFALPLTIPFANSDELLRQRQIQGIRPRQYRLLACALARWLEPLILGSACRQAIAKAEQFADGECTRKELAQAEAKAWDDWRRQPGPADPDEAARATALRAEQEAAWTALRAVRGGFRNTITQIVEVKYHQIVQSSPPGLWPKLLAAIDAIEDQVASSLIPYAHLETATIIEEVLGPRIPPSGISTFRKWNGGTLVRLATTIYQSQNFADLAILADALEEAGCSDEYTLEHCRTRGTHYRGCWVLDWILNKDIWK
ncbi:MAG: hypothetical protein ACFCD0_27535 [Gemmataceae bacterium]